MIEVPIIVIVCGEGGSGGALGIAIGDRVFMQEFSVYSVIPPEGCAAILWRDANRKVEAAEALKITAQDMTALGLVDGIIPEPPGGAHNDHERATALVDQALSHALAGGVRPLGRGAAQPALRQVPADGGRRHRRSWTRTSSLEADNFQPPTSRPTTISWKLEIGSCLSYLVTVTVKN